MTLAFVVTTLGRLPALDRLLGSLAGQLERGDRLVIVAQERADAVRELVARHTFPAGVATVTVSGRGASLGRNVGVAELGGDPLLVFPNDTTWFPAGAVAALRTAADASGLTVGALTVVDEHGPKFVLPPPGTPLDRWNVWTVIEMGLLVRRSLFLELGGFDASIGTGAPTPWQAGEVTDLLLRMLARRPDVAAGFVWMPPEVAVGGISDPAGLTTAERRRKLRGYGRGLGRLVVVHRYPRWWRAAFVVGGLAFGFRHRSTHRPADGWWAFVGRLEGVAGHAVGGATRAVSR